MKSINEQAQSYVGKGSLHNEDNIIHIHNNVMRD